MYCSSCAAALPSAPPVTCSTCGTSHWHNAKPCAGALVAEGNKLLVLRRAHDPWYGRWDLPGGFCDGAEHPVATAVRETKEETGLAVDIVGLLGMWLDVYSPPRAGFPDEVTLNIFYHADLVGPYEPVLEAAEASEIRWAGPDQLPSLEELAFPRQLGPVLDGWRRVVTEGLARRTWLPDDPRRRP